MTAVPVQEPIFSQVTVALTDGHTDALTVTDRVVAALEYAGECHAANAFLAAVDICETDDEILAVACSLVTVIE